MPVFMTIHGPWIVPHLESVTLLGTEVLPEAESEGAYLGVPNLLGLYPKTNYLPIRFPGCSEKFIRAFSLDGRYGVPRTNDYGEFLES